MNSNDSQQSLSESQLSINSLLSVINPAEEPKDSFEETFDRQNAEQTNTEKTTTDDYDWECLSEPQEEDISVETTRQVSSFAETVSIIERVMELKAAFEAEFPVGKAFVDKDIARLEIQSFIKTNKIPFETCKSNTSYIKMICKHFGKYRAAKKGEDEEDFGTGEGLESVAQRSNQTTGRTGCSAFDMFHNHPLSEDRRAYHNNRNLNAEDQELAISLMRAGTTPSETLKMLETRGVNNLIVTDLANIQQQFCRDNHTNMWNFIKNLESSGHQVRYMTNADERICCCVVVDATYKTNSHKMVLLNFVVVGTLRSKEKPKQLVTVPIAGCWIDRETDDRCRWSMNCFREIVWPVVEITGNLPKCFVTDNGEALLRAIKSVFPERNLSEMEVKFFMAIIKQMALSCATKSEFLLDKDAYETFVSTKGMCVKGGAQTMIKYLHHMMVKKQFWVGYYVNNLMHMGNRTSNRVESAHVNIKRSNNASSGSMAVVIEKIDLWIKKREDYRNLQSIKESASQRPVFLEHDIADQLSFIRLNVSSFAFESVKNELIEMKASEENPDHVSYVRSGENCLFATVAEVSAELGKDSSPELCSNTNEVQFRLEKLLSLCKVLGSQQESVDLLKDMDALIVKYKPSEVVTRNSDNSNLFKMLDSQYADDVLGFVNPISN
ncbi:hypothetical protein INT47_004935, partial [Mucor saturninus]